MKLTWVLVNCNSTAEAKKIGQAVLKKRLCACFDIFPRQAAFYFWPPRSKKIESAKGSLLILETLPAKVSAIKKLAQKLHSDKLPFIGSLEIKDIPSEYHKWLKGELK